MGLLVRFNIIVIAGCTLAIVAISLICRTTLEQGARSEILDQAALMSDSALAMRAYTAAEIDPLLERQMTSTFLPQSVPFYAATQNFLALHAAHPQYAYKEATLNPTNLRDRAADWEADIIQRFRNDASAQQIVGERATPMGPSLYLAKPIRAESGCLTCHGLASAAPAMVVARYGANNGFGWAANEVVGAQVISVPLAGVQANASRAWQNLMLRVIAVFALLWLMLNLAWYGMLVRPLRRIAHTADQLSRGEGGQARFAPGGARELATLARAFERMRISLEKSLRLLEK